jgi:hypothetical protein
MTVNITLTVNQSRQRCRTAAWSRDGSLRALLAREPATAAGRRAVAGKYRDAGEAHIGEGTFTGPAPRQEATGQ